MERKQDYIAVFDSGVGGISVLRHLCRLLPCERFLYFGDSANAPYGTRPTGQICDLTLEAAEKLMVRGSKALVVACNTATAAAIEALRNRYPNKIIIGIEPALKPAADKFPGGCIGVMGTPATLRENKFAHQLEIYGAKCQVVKLPAPGLVELIEAGQADSEEARQLLRNLLEPWSDKLDALVLGCTHYPFAVEAIRDVLGERTLLLDGGEGTARETKRRLAEADLLREGHGEVILENSSANPEMIALSRRLLEQS